MAIKDTPTVTPSWVFREDEQPKPGQAEEGPGFLDALPAAFRQNNTVASFANMLNAPSGPIDPDFDPFKDIAGYEEHTDAFAYANTLDDVTAIKGKIDQELNDKRVLAEAGWSGIAANMAAGILDPINLIPVGGVAYKTYRTGGSILKGAAVTAAATAGSVSAAEASLQATQITRDFGESATNIAASAFVGGMLGAGASYVARRALVSSDIEAQLERNLTLPEGNDPYQPGGFAMNEGALVKDLNQTLSSAGVRRSTLAEEKLKSAFGFEKVEMTPALRMAGSPSLKTRILQQRMMNNPFTYEKNSQGIASPSTNVEAEIKKRKYPLAVALQSLDQDFVKYRGGGNFVSPIVGKDMLASIGAAKKSGKLSYDEFKTEVARAMRRGDEHKIPEVAAAAKRFRSQVFDPLKDEAIKLGLLADDVDVTTATSYLTRSWDADKIVRKRADFERIVRDWLVKKEAPDSTRDLRFVASQITDRILGTPAGRLPYDVLNETAVASGGKSTTAFPLKARVFDIPDELVEEFLENDIELVAKRYVQSLVPDLQLAREFGSTHMTKEIDEVRAEYANRIASIDADVKAGKYGAANRKKLEAAEAGKYVEDYEKAKEQISASLAKERDSDIIDIEAVRDRLRGTYGQPNDPNHWAVRTARTGRSLSYMTSLGGMAVNSLPDMSRAVMAHGLGRVMKDGLVPLIKNFKTARLAMEEIKLAGTALDVVMDSRAMAIADITDDYGRGSKFERGVSYAASQFGTLTGMNHMNAALKQFAGMVSMSKMFKLAESYATLGKGDIEKLAAAGIDRAMAKRLSEQFKKYGQMKDGVYLPNTGDWDDSGALTTFRTALQREVDTIVVTPGVGDAPLFMSSELGKTIMQFKSFAFASYQRTNVWAGQRRDMAVLQGIVTTTGLGALVYAYNQLINGKEISDDPAVWIKEGIDRSGVLALPFEANNTLETISKGRLGLSAVMGQEANTRYRNRSLTEVLAGPTIGYGAKAASTVGAFGAAGLTDTELSEADIKAFRRLIPFQNHFALRFLFDEFEAGTKEILDIPTKAKK